MMTFEIFLENIHFPPCQILSEDSLLAAMENAGREEMPDDAERKGIGTPATRAGILEKLVTEKLVQRRGSGKHKHFVPTAKGSALIAVLPEQLQSPLLTAEWEQRLKEIEHGKADADEFMQEIIGMVTDLVKTVKRVPNADELFPSEKESLGKCPVCGSAVFENPQGFCCSDRSCRFAIWKNNRYLAPKNKPLTAAIVRELLANGSVSVPGSKGQANRSLYLDPDEEGNIRIRVGQN